MFGKSWNANEIPNTMGGSSSTDLGNSVGIWFNGKPIYPKDMAMIQAGINEGKYIRVASGAHLPDDHELWFTLTDGNIRYARKMNDFKQWWFRNKDRIAAAASKTAAVSPQVTLEVVKVALPALVDRGREAARRVVDTEIKPELRIAAYKVIDALDKHIHKSPHGHLDQQPGQAAHGLSSADARGRTAGTADFYSNVSPHAYIGSAQGSIDAGYTGGCGCDGRFIGSDEMDLTSAAEYVNSANSKAKNQIIGELIKTASNLGIKVTGETQNEQIKSILDSMVGKKINPQDETHKKLCRALALAINSAYGNEIINATLPAEVICQQVAELISSLAAGMHTEFLAVYNDVKKVLKNLHILKDTLKDDHDSIMLKIKEESGDTFNNLSNLNELHGILTSEIDRQIQLLSNLLNVTLLPSEKSLSKLIADKKELHGYIDKINVKVGSEKFSKVISDLLRGVGLTANFALVIESALKTVGMTVAEYAKNESVQKLREKIAQGLMGKTMNDEQLHEYLKAAELLYRNFYRSNDIAKTLTGAYDLDPAEFTGGDEKFYKSAIDRRVADRKKMRDLIFTTFYRKLNGIFDQMIVAIDHLTMKVGTEIPLSDQLDSFRQVLQRIDESIVRDKNIYYAMIGYYNDALSKSKKNEFVSNLKMVLSYIESITEMSMYASSKSYFIAVQEQIKAIITTIDQYTDEITAKFGRGEDVVDCESIEGGFEGVYGGDDSIAEDNRVLYKTTKTIQEALRQFDFKYRASQFRQNLNATSKELKEYAAKYDKLVANSIADILTEDKKIYDKLMKHLQSEGAFGQNSDYKIDRVEGFDSDEAVAEQRAAAVKMLEVQWEAKKKFWATIEAVDSYMRVFTDAIVKNPQDIKDIKSMLESVEIINDWYDEKTGENLASVFDFFPSVMLRSPNNPGIAIDRVTYPPEGYTSDDIADHYYSRINADLSKRGLGPDQSKSLPGNPYLVTLPTRGSQALLKAQKTMRGLAILKNLLSVFNHIGDRFGGQEIRKQVFMTPFQMYENLVNYIQTSAFAQGFGVGDFNSAPEDELPMGFYSSDNISVDVDMASGVIANRSLADGTSDPNTFGRREADTYSTPGHAYLGVTLAAGQSITDYQYAKSAIAPVLVSKINSASKKLATANDLLRPAGTDETWGSSYQPAQKVLLFKKRWGVWMRSVLPGLQEMEGFSFKREDEYFVLMIKSLAAKILTVVGMYDVLDRPMEFNGLSPIRMILGGAPETPKVDAEAVALYLRLPLLAQFYRGIFGFEGEEDPINNFQDYKTDKWRVGPQDNMMKISMVPDIDGTFAGLIRLVFRKNKFVSGVNYSDDDLKELVREINTIFQKMRSKHPQNTVMETINEFIAEINRRFGVVSQNDRNKYEAEFGYNYDYSTIANDRLNPVDRYSTPPETDIIILPGEGEMEVQRLSSAQKLLGETFETSSEKQNPFTVSTEHKKMVYRFRCAIDKYLEDPQEQFTFNNIIKITQLKLKNEQNDENRFKLVASLVRGSDVYSKVDSMKHVLFHETVVSGLTMLSAMHSILARFKNRIHLIDLHALENLIIGRGGFLDSAGDKEFTKLLAFVNKYFTETMGLFDPEDDRLKALIYNVFGFQEAQECNGGHVSLSENAPFALKGTDGIRIGSTGNSAICQRWIDSNAGNVFGVTNNMTITTDYGNPNNPPRAAGIGGLNSILAGYTASELREAYIAPNYTPKNKQAKAAIETFMRFIFGREFIMKELIESLFGLGNDFQGLVDVKIESGKLLLNYGGLKTLIEDMFQHVSYFLDLLRPHIKPDLLDRYTNKLTPGSYYWLQEQLMEKIIIGRPAQLTAPSGEPARVGYTSLDELMRKLTYTYDRLTREWEVNGAEISISQANSNISMVKSRSSYDKVFAEMIFYDASRPASGLLKSNSASVFNPDDTAALNGVNIVDYMNDPFESLHLSGTPGNKVLDTRYAARFGQLYSWKDEFTFNRSALFSFNQLIAKYIQAFYDPVGGKIYNGITNQFANGAFSRAVGDPMLTYPDTVPLWFVKYAGADEVTIPNSTLMSKFAENDDLEKLDALKQLVNQYLKIGIHADDYKDASKRGGLLFKTSNSDLMKTTQNIKVPRDSALNNTPMIYVYMLAHIIGAVATDVLNNTSALPPDTVIDDNNPLIIPASVALLSMCGGIAYSPATAIGALRSRFTGSPDANQTFTIQSVMSRILGRNVADLITMVNDVVGEHSKIDEPADAQWTTLFIAPAPGSPLRELWDAYDNPIPDDFKGPLWPSNKYKLILRDVLRLPGRIITKTDDVYTSNDYGGILPLACSVYPFSDDIIGRTEVETTYRIGLFSVILLRLAKAFETMNQMAYTKFVRDLSSEIIGVKKTYSPGLPAQPQKSVKLDDLMLVNTSFLTADKIESPLSDANFLVMARGAAVPGAGLESDNMRKLGLAGTPTNGDSDSIAAVQQFGRRGDPDQDHILFTSLATVLRNLVSTKNTSNQTAAYVQENVADIALYMKEKMRANLPIFRNLFKELISRCEFTKKLMNRPEVNMQRNFSMVGTGDGAQYIAGVEPMHNPWPYVLLDPRTDSTTTKNRFTGILDGITRGCTALVSSCEQVLREIGDDPKYFELYQNSIKDYKTQNGTDPLMPLSSTLCVLKNVDKANEMDFFPLHALGQDQFKFAYGTRSLLGQPTAQPLSEHIVGFTQLVDSFNLTVDGKMHADKTHAEGFMKTFVKMLRYVYELKHIKSILTPYILTRSTAFGHPNLVPDDAAAFLHISGMFARDDLVLTSLRRVDRQPRPLVPGHGGKPGIFQGNSPVILTNRSDVSIVADGDNAARASAGFRKEYPVCPYSIMKTITDTIKLTESSFKEDKIKELVEYLIKDGEKPAKSLEIQNIIDLGIVPINVHALMRSIPLANLYNYAYTFDRLIIELYYGLQNKNAQKLIAELCDYTDGDHKLKNITSAKDMLVALLINPYMNLFSDGNDGPMDDGQGINLYNKHAKDMLLGRANAGELGRPKFLSDQVFGKVVFGQMYEDRTSYNEAGPMAVNSSKISRENGIDAVINYVASSLAMLNSGGKFLGKILNIGIAPNQTLIRAVAQIVHIVAKKPSISLNNLVDESYRFLMNNTDLDTILPAADDAQREYFIILASIATKLAYTSISLFVNAVNARGANNDIAVEYARALTISMALFDNIGRANRSDFLGITMTNKNDGRAPNDSTDALTALMSTYNANGFAHNRAITGLSEALKASLSIVPDDGFTADNLTSQWNTIFPRLFGQLVGINIKLLIDKASAEPPMLIPANRALAMLNGLTNRGIHHDAKATTLDHASNYLHWIDTRNVSTVNDFGVGLQPDNDNVLDPHQVHRVNVAPIRNILAQIGRMRFDTVFIRNLIFITNLYRSIRMKLQRDLVYSKDIVLRSEPITRTQLTEFFGNQTDAVNRRAPYDTSAMWRKYDY